MDFIYPSDAVRVLVLELGPDYYVEMVLPRDQTLYHDRLRQFIESSYGLFQSRIVELTPKFRVVIPERRDLGDLVTIQALLRDTDDTRESWRVAIQGPAYLMSDICRRLRNGDESAKTAIICHATGEKMNSWFRCDQCEDRDPLLGGCRVVEGSFRSACSNCIYRGRQKSCTVRYIDDEYQPSSKNSVTIQKRKSCTTGREVGEEQAQKRPRT
ncbi:hypothetical protein EDB80DRAFT_740211, partial [Ilyonectria destructans]